MKKLVLVAVVLLCMSVAVGCGGQKVEVSLEDVFEDIKAVVKADLEEVMDEEAFETEELPGYIVADLESEEAEYMLAGINEDDLEEGYMIAPMMNTSSDMILLFQAKEGKADSVMASLDEVLESQTETWSTYLPDQFEKVENAIIEQEGDYVLYVVYSAPETIQEVFTEAIK